MKLDCATLATMPPPARRRIVLLQDACTAIAGAARGTRMDVLAIAAQSLDITEKSLHRIFRNWIDSGKSWDALVDRRTIHQPNNTGLPGAFVQYVQQLHEQHQRDTSGAQVSRVIISRWQQWRETGDPRHAIPGYDFPPPAGIRGYPAGWSPKTILRLRPSKYNLTIMRRGKKAASALLPDVLTTRVGLAFGQRIFFDDQEYDNKVVLPGMQSKPMRPVGFNALDHLSGAFLDYCLKLKRLDESTDTVKSLTKQDFTWFVLRLLQRIGYRDDAAGTTLIFEHGTADAYRNQLLTSGSGHHSFDDAIAAVTNGRVTIARSGRFGDPAFAGMLFRGQASGNFRFKSPIESMFNLVRNHAAALPGSTGRMFQLAPEEQPGIEREDEQLVAVWNALAPERRQLIDHFHHLTFQEFGILFRDIYRAINCRTIHALEGWDKLGFVAPEFTLDNGEHWQPRDRLLRLPDDRREAVSLMADWRDRRMSPAEIVSLHADQLTRLSWTATPLVIPLEWARHAKVNQKHTIRITDPLIDPEPLTYIAQATTITGRRENLCPGDEILCYVNPFDPQSIVACDTKGRLIGLLDRTHVATAGTDAAFPTMGRIANLRATMAISSETRAATLMEERQSMVRLRHDLESGDPATPEEKSAAAAVTRRASAAARLGDPDTWDALSDRDPEPPPSAPVATLDDLL
jgi:hypothetical protein